MRTTSESRLGVRTLRLMREVASGETYKALAVREGVTPARIAQITRDTAIRELWRRTAARGRAARSAVPRTGRDACRLLLMADDGVLAAIAASAKRAT